MYDDRCKRNSVAKCIMNAFLREFVDVGDKAIVIDGPSLRSAAALSKKLLPGDIRVLSTDLRTVAQARKAGFSSTVGRSTEILCSMQRIEEELKKYKVIYLDYCGTPAKKKKWDPADDFRLASSLLSADGVVVATFSRRCSGAQSKINKLLWPAAQLICTFNYCETVPMTCVIVGTADPDVVKCVGALFRKVRAEFPQPSRTLCSSRGRLLRKRKFFEFDRERLFERDRSCPLRRSKRLCLQQSN